VEGENGLLTEDCVEGLARAMIRISLDDELHTKLVAGCKDWSERISIGVMADRYAEGIMSVLRDAG
jgi:hypothetical protein